MLQLEIVSPFQLYFNPLLILRFVIQRVGEYFNFCKTGSTKYGG